MTKPRRCAECQAPLRAGVPDVFCPACAFRHALGAGKPAPKRFLMRPINWLRRLRPGNRYGGREEIILASPEDKGGHSASMSRVAPVSGDVIEEYELLEKVGGNMGVVFKARHRLLDKVVALKLLPAHWIADSTARARFLREMRVMGHLEHPNLVTASDARSFGEWHLVAMEWIDGIDLLHLARNHGPLPVDAACEAARQAAVGLQYAHEHGLIHRDIKPSNLMLTRGGTIKVIDMGLALAKDESAERYTRDGDVVGTMSYCAPEQLCNASKVDIRADIYSLGCTLYHLLAGKSPYGQRKNLKEIMHAHLHEPFPKLLDARPDAPPVLEEILARMTAKDPDARYATPVEVVEALEPLARGADVKALVPASSEPPPPGRTIIRPDRSPASPQAQRPVASTGQRSTTRWPRIAAILLALLLVLAGALFLAVKREPIIMLMDTTAEGGVYDPDNKLTGGSNTKEASSVLQTNNFLPPSSLIAAPIAIGWAGEAQVVGRRPDLVIIHRSTFWHPVNAVLKLGRPPFTNHLDEAENKLDEAKWQSAYSLADDKLILFMGIVATQVRQTKFLIYSRGTDPNWLNEDYRKDWVKKIESRIPALKGRIKTMVVPGGYGKGTFRDPETGKQLRQRVKEILKLPDKEQ